MQTGQPDAAQAQRIASDWRLAVVVSRFNADITERLLEGAQRTWREQGGNTESLEVFHVPGAFELPLLARRLALSGRYAAVACLGCVIRGDTDHYVYVCDQAAAGIMRAGLDSDLPVIFGLLTTDTHQQALDRAGGSAGNKGTDAVLAAIEMVNVLQAASDPTFDV